MQNYKKCHFVFYVYVFQVVGCISVCDIINLGFYVLSLNVIFSHIHPGTQCCWTVYFFNYNTINAHLICTWMVFHHCLLLMWLQLLSTVRSSSAVRNLYHFHSLLWNYLTERYKWTKREMNNSNSENIDIKEKKLTEKSPNNVFCCVFFPLLIYLSKKLIKKEKTKRLR